MTKLRHLLPVVVSDRLTCLNRHRCQVAPEENEFLTIYYFFERVRTMKDRYLTPQEVAELLSISYDTALNLIKYSGLEAVQIGRQYRVLESKLNEFLYPPKVAKQPLRQRPIYQIVEERK